MNSAGFDNGALGDVRVLELVTLLAGPFCGQLLGDMGAEVIKVEPPGQGDPMRNWGRQKQGEPSLWWPVIARNKQAVTLDLRQAEGQQLLLELADDELILGCARLAVLREGALECDVLGRHQELGRNAGAFVEELQQRRDKREALVG